MQINYSNLSFKGWKNPADLAFAKKKFKKELSEMEKFTRIKQSSRRRKCQIKQARKNIKWILTPKNTDKLDLYLEKTASGEPMHTLVIRPKGDISGCASHVYHIFDAFGTGIVRKAIENMSKIC